MSLVSDNNHLPVMLVAPELVCQDLAFRSAKGKMLKGLRDCRATNLPECSKEGEIHCRTNALVKATIVADLAEQVAVGKVVAGVAGRALHAPRGITSLIQASIALLDDHNEVTLPTAMLRVEDANGKK